MGGGLNGPLTLALEAPVVPVAKIIRK